jgi:phenylalanyl-tRNA synthetase alpha chain
MEQLVQQIELYRQEIAAAEAGTPEAAEEFRIKWLGTKGLVKAVMGEMKNVPNEGRKAFGQVLNDFKLFAENKYESLKQDNAGPQAANASSIDWSLPGNPIPVGTRHPLNIVRNQIVVHLQKTGICRG